VTKESVESNFYLFTLFFYLGRFALSVAALYYFYRKRVLVGGLRIGKCKSGLGFIYYHLCACF